jgi:hypothetical protein
VDGCVTVITGALGSNLGRCCFPGFGLAAVTPHCNL